MLKRFALVAVAAAAFAVFEHSAAQDAAPVTLDYAENYKIVTLDYAENDARFRTEQPCQAFGGILVSLVGGEMVCRNIDTSGTFCIVDSRDAFPCGGFYKHVAACNREYNRIAFNPSFCGRACRSGENYFARGKQCVEGPFQCPTQTGDVPGTCDDLHEAAGHNDADCARLLIDGGRNADEQADDLRAPMHDAARRNACQVAMLLIESDANVDARDDFGWAPLHTAAQHDASVVAFLLIEDGAEVNAADSQGRTPLHIAAEYNNPTIAALLLKNGATVDAKSISGETPLFFTALNDAHETAALLLQNRAEVNAKGNYDWTPLHWAARYNASVVATLLMQNGATVNAKDDLGQTPLHYAAFDKARETAELLLENGASINAEDDAGQTPLDLARGPGSEAVITLLLENGAEVGTPRLNVIPAHSRVASGQMIEFHGGQIILTDANLPMLSPVRLTGASTINVTGAGENAVALGFGENPFGTVKFIPDEDSGSGMYVFDIPEHLVSVGAGGLVWDDSQLGWARTAAGGAVSVLLYANAFSLSVGNDGNMNAFVLHEGGGEIDYDGSPADAQLLECGEPILRSANRADIAFFKTECYGDIEIMSAGFTGVNSGDQIVAIESPVVLSSESSGGAFVMYGGRNDGGSPEVAFVGVGAMTVLNNTNDGIRYVRMDGDFMFDGQAIGCDHENDTVLAYSGGVTAYCPRGLDAFLNVNIPPVGIANNGFSGGILLTLPNPLNVSGIEFSYSVNEPGFSLDENWVLSATPDAIAALRGGNTVQIRRNLEAIPGVPEISGAPQVLDVIVHKLADTGSMIILLNRDNDQAFPNGNQISGDDYGFLFYDAGNAVSGVESSTLPAGINYTPNMFSIPAQLTEIGSYMLVVTVQAPNIRGTHVMTVRVDVVDLAVIGSEFVVRPRANIAAPMDYTGPIAGMYGANLRAAGDPTGNVNITCRMFGDSSDFGGLNSLSNGCDLNLTSALGADASKVVTVEIVHEATESYQSALLAPPFDALQDSIAPRTVEAVITVWRTEVTSPQAAGPTRSNQPISGISFAPPTNVGGIDFADFGANWDGAVTEGLTIMTNGDITGTPAVQVDNYTIPLIANFSHPHLVGGFSGIQLNLMVIHKSPQPATVIFSAGANGTLAVEVNGARIASGDSVPVGAEIVFTATPDAGHHVSLWTDAQGADAACGRTGSVSRGGAAETCRVIAGDDADYNVMVSFAAGAIHADIAEIIKGMDSDAPVPAEQDALEAVCLALGGTIDEYNQCLDYVAGSKCAIAPPLGTVSEGTCFAGGVFAFRNVLNCNLQNRMAAGNVAACGDACGAGEVAVGGACVTPYRARVNYQQPEGGSLEVFRLYGGGAVRNGDAVPHGVLLSLVAAPGPNHYVSGWGGCGGGETGNLAESGAGKACVARVDMERINLAVSLSQSPSGTYPLSLTGDIEGNQDNCEALGGAYADVIGGVCRGFTEDAGPAGNCAFNHPSGYNQCTGAFINARDCNLARRRAANTTSCGGMCSGQLAVGGACRVEALNQSRGLAIQNEAGRAAPDRARAREAVIRRAGLDQSGNRDAFFFRAMADNSDRRFFAGADALPDILDPGVVREGGNVNDTVSNCLALGGSNVSAGSAYGDAFCVGLATGGDFCLVGDTTGFFPCYGELGLFNVVARCNVDENKPAAGFAGCAENACPEGLTARGSECIAVDGVGNELPDRAEGALPVNLPHSGEIEDSIASCLALGGSDVSADPADGDAFCVGIATDDFCLIGDKTGFFSCPNLFDRVRECNLNENKPAADIEGCAPEACKGGLVARGSECVAPPPAEEEE